MVNKNIFQRYGYFWVTLALFLISIIGHWLFGWSAYKQEQETHDQPVVMSEYVIEMGRDTLENWQSEFLQLIWQVAGLAFLFYLGSPQSKEGDERVEEKLDAILKAVDKDGEERIKNLDKKYVRQ